MRLIPMQIIDQKNQDVDGLPDANEGSVHNFALKLIQLLMIIAFTWNTPGTILERKNYNGVEGTQL
jgi:hypothetical protein